MLRNPRKNKEGKGCRRKKGSNRHRKKEREKEEGKKKMHDVRSFVTGYHVLILASNNRTTRPNVLQLQIYKKP